MVRYTTGVMASFYQSRVWRHEAVVIDILPCAAGRCCTSKDLCHSNWILILQQYHTVCRSCTSLSNESQTILALEHSERQVCTDVIHLSIPGVIINIVKYLTSICCKQAETETTCKHKRLSWFFCLWIYLNIICACAKEWNLASKMQQFKSDSFRVLLWAKLLLHPYVLASLKIIFKHLVHL